MYHKLYIGFASTFLLQQNLLPSALISKCHVCTFNSSSLGFYSSFRLPLTTVEEVKAFVATVKEKSLVTWRIQRTDPFKMSAGCKNLFWAQYRCQSSSNRVSKNTLNPHTKHTNCRAKMVITLKRTLVERSRTKDPHMPMYPTIVSIRHEHNHPLSSAEALRFRDVSSETTQKFKCLLRRGYSVASAMKLHKIDLQWEYGENYFQIIADRSICPDTGWAHRLCDRLFKNETKKSKDSLLQDLQEKIREINKGRDVPHVKMEQLESQTVVAVCTPLMHCVHKLLPQSAEVVFMDTSGAVDRYYHSIYLVLTHSCAAGLPLGIIITTSEREQLITRGLLMLQSLVGQNAFHGQSVPAVFMTSDSLMEQKAVANSLPGTTCLTGICHMLRDTWHWLCEAEHEIALPHRPLLNKIVNSLVLANSEEDLVGCYTAACLDPIALKYPYFMLHLNRMWDQRHQWAVALCQNQVLNAKRTEIAGAVLQSMKDTIIHRLKAFNIIQLLDVIFSRLDCYYCHRILGFTTNKHKSVFLKQYMPLEYSIEDFEIKQVSEEVFEVVDGKLNETYQVNVSIGCCSCRIGISGAPCKHQYSAARKFNITSFSFFLLYDPSHEYMLKQIIAESENSITVIKPETSAEEEKASGETNLSLPVLHTVDSSENGKVTENHCEANTESMNGLDENESIHSNSDSVCDTNAEEDEINKCGGICNTVNSSETTNTLISLKTFYEDLHHKLITQSEIYQSAVEIFLQNYSHLHTDTARVSALKMFAKGFTEELTKGRMPTDQEDSGNKDTCLQMTVPQKITSVTQLEYHPKRIRTEDGLFSDPVKPPR